jgi:hypothetical protein
MCSDTLGAVQHRAAMLRPARRARREGRDLRVPDGRRRRQGDGTGRLLRTREHPKDPTAPESASARGTALFRAASAESVEIPLASFGATSTPEGGSRLMAAAL